MGFTSAVDKFEFLGTLARSVVCFAGLGAPVENVDALRGLLTTVWFWTRETAVSSHARGNVADPSEVQMLAFS